MPDTIQADGYSIEIIYVQGHNQINHFLAMHCWIEQGVIMSLVAGPQGANQIFITIPKGQ